LYYYSFTFSGFSRPLAGVKKSNKSYLLSMLNQKNVQKSSMFIDNFEAPIEIMNLNLFRILTILIAFLSVSLTDTKGNPHPDWADSVLQTMSTEEKLAQLLMIRAYAGRDTGYTNDLTRTISRYQVGGITFFKGSPVNQAKLTNRWQSLSKIPMLISIDAEWGLGMRLDSCISFPKQMTLGAIRGDTLIYAMGAEIARECRRMGIHMNFAPVADINNNPLNPVIFNRSFGEDKHIVSSKGIAYLKGMQDQGVIATAKHFPGHGDTDQDSHYTLPLINASRARLDTLELYPFREMIKAGVEGIMVAHLSIPSLDSTKKRASTLSPWVVSKLLRFEMGFKGLIITDALDMKGVTKYYPSGEAEVRAFIAGNDILLLPENVPTAISSLCKAMDDELITLAQIDEKCRKILKAKQKVGLDRYRPVPIPNLADDLNTSAAKALNQELYRKAMVVIRNIDSTLPLKNLEQRQIACISIGSSTGNVFQSSITRYCPVTCYSAPSFTPMSELLQAAKKANTVILSMHALNGNPKQSYGFPSDLGVFIDSLPANSSVILAIFGTPYVLPLIPNAEKIKSIVLAHQESPESMAAAAEVIFGGTAAKGQLPVSGGISYPLATGFQTDVTRLSCILPEEARISSKSLIKIDELIQQGILDKAYPGCQVLMAKDGEVFYDKAFGNPTYDDTEAVKPHDLYDLASLTKVLATTLAVMKLYDDTLIDLDKKAYTYLPILRHTDKKHITVRQLLAHASGLKPFIPFYLSTLKDGQPDPAIYATSRSDSFPVQVADNLFIRAAYRQAMIDTIIDSKAGKNKKYVYSDLNFILLREIIENITCMPMEQYLEREFYQSLGLTTLCFNPLDKFPVDRIMPTENDQVFRKQLLHGHVHDQAAAMMGGVSGHAGLFSNAGDLAVILQMILNKGKYGGTRYLREATVEEFTRVQFPEKENRRGAGFDMPPLEPDPNGPVCLSASPLSFGHSGFTGTYFWADPANNLIYVFLSNRIYPDVNNTKLAKMNIRTNIHQAIYDILKTQNQQK